MGFAGRQETTRQRTDMSALNVVLLAVFGCAAIIEAFVASGYENRTVRRLGWTSVSLFAFAAALNAFALMLEAAR